MRGREWERGMTGMVVEDMVEGEVAGVEEVEVIEVVEAADGEAIGGECHKWAIPRRSFGLHLAWRSWCASKSEDSFHLFLIIKEVNHNS